MKAAFFDMDGTLVDSKSDLCATVNHARRDFGLPERPESEIIVHVGLGARHLLESAIPELAGNVEELRDRFMARYGEHMLERVRPYPGVEETLERLASRGWLLGVNTAKPAFAVKAILEKFGLDRFFGAAVVAGGDCAEMKPSALPLVECSARMGGRKLSPGDWMIGDNWTDVECAKNAGVNSAFCTFGFGRRGETRPTAEAGSFAELDGLLGDAS